MLSQVRKLDFEVCFLLANIQLCGRSVFVPPTTLFTSYICIEIFYSLFLSLSSSSFSEIGDLALKKPDKREEGNERTHKKANKGRDLSSFKVELFWIFGWTIWWSTFHIKLRKEQMDKNNLTLVDMEDEVNVLAMEELKLVNLDNISLNYSESMNLSSLEETWETTMDTWANFKA